MLQAVGDVRIKESSHHLTFAGVRAALRRCDVLFGNCECTYEGQAGSGHRCDRDCVIGTIQRAGFTVMSCANNRFGDTGRDGILRTLDLLAEHGIATCGAGRNATGAHRPALVTVKGSSLAFLAYTAVRDPNGRADVPEIANVHPQTSYTNVEPNQPGAPPLVTTRMDPRELAEIVDTVRAARGSVERLFVSVHWGIHLLPFVIADYERELAHAVIDAGADGVFGHHQHVLKPIELYRDRPIFYGLGNFLSYVSPENKNTHNFEPLDARRRFGEYRSQRYSGTWSNRPPRMRLTVIARCTFDAGAAPRVELVPCRLDRLNRPVACEAESPTGKRVVGYLREASEVAELATTFSARPGSPLISVTG